MDGGSKPSAYAPSSHGTDRAGRARVRFIWFSVDVDAPQSEVTIESVPETLEPQNSAAPVDAEALPPIAESIEVFAAPSNELIITDVLPMLAVWNRLSEPVSMPSDDAAAAGI